METKKVRDQRLGWTNERHLHFLNSVEASFVRTMLDHHNNTGTGAYRMDRYLPDSSDSTADLKNDQRRRRHSASDILDQRVTVDRRGRRSFTRACQPQTTCHEDQVVPQLENRRDENTDDEKDRPGSVDNVGVTPAN